MNDKAARNVLLTWRKSLRNEVAEIESVFSDTLPETDKAKAEAAFRKIREGFEELRKIIDR